MNARAYLRASTDEQDARRAKAEVEAFAAERGLDIVGWYAENEFGRYAGPSRVVPTDRRFTTWRRAVWSSKLTASRA